MEMADRSKRIALLSLCLSAFALLGCGDDEDPGKAKPPRRDSGTERDAEPADASERIPDAGKLPDTGSPEDGLIGSCAIDSNKIFSITQRSDPFLGTPLAVDPIGSVFALPFVGRASGCLDVLNLTRLQGGSQGGDPETTVAVDRCALIKEAAVSARAGEWVVAMIDNREPPFDVWVQRFDASMREVGSTTRLSNAGAVETAIAITTTRDGTRTLVAWGDESSEGNALYVRVLGADATPHGEPVRIDQSSTLTFRSLSLAPLGAAAGTGLAYWRYSADFATSELVFHALDGNGMPVRDAWVLASNVGTSGSIDVATDAAVGAIVWSRAEGTTGRQVWFQRIDPDGRAAALFSGPGSSPALRVVNAPARGIDVSIAKLRSGYVVSYRSLPTPAQERAEIRLVFLDPNGALVGDSDVSFTSEAGGRTAVETANDGRVVLGWSQVNSDGKSELKLVRVPCIGS